MARQSEQIGIPSITSVSNVPPGQRCQRTNRLRVGVGSIALQTQLSITMDILTTKYQTEKHLLMASDAPQPLMHLLYRMTPVEFANLRKILGLSSRGGRPRVSVTIDQADELKDLFRSLASRLTELPVSTLFLLVAEGSVHSTRTLWQVLRVELMQLVESGRCLTPGGLNAGG